MYVESRLIVSNARGIWLLVSSLTFVTTGIWLNIDSGYDLLLRFPQTKRRPMKWWQCSFLVKSSDWPKLEVQ